MIDASYRDALLGGLIKELRALLKSQPTAEMMLGKLRKG